MMDISRHPNEDTILGHAAGTLHPALAFVVEVHRQLCPVCRDRYRSAVALGGGLLEDIEVVSMEPTQVSDAWERMRNHIHADGGEPVRQASGVAVGSTEIGPRDLLARLRDGVAWKRLAPGIEQFVLPGSGGTDDWVRLFRFQHGFKVPMHTHAADEFTVVLQGSYVDGTGRYATGDFSEADNLLEHRPRVDSKTPCIALIGATGRTRFLNPAVRAFGHLIGI